MGETIPFAKRGPSRARTDEAAVSAALAEVARRAAAADAGSEDLGPSLAALRQAGVFDILAAYADPVPGDRVVGEIVTLLRRIGRANLSVGRLVEGHLNAHRLVALYAFFNQRYNSFILFGCRPINLIMEIFSHTAFMCGNFNNIETIYIGKFAFFCHGCSRHTRKLRIESEIILEGY